MNIEEQVRKASLSELLEVVNAGLHCRRTQREYFKLRSEERLYRAKEAETRLDRALEHILNIGKPFQNTLV